MKKYNITKDLKNKSLTRVLIELFVLIIVYTYLLAAISLIIFSFPLVLVGIINDNRIDPLKLYGYIAFVSITIFLALVMIKKHGAEKFWKTLIRYDVFYRGRSGKYYKWFIYFIIFFIVFANIAAYLQYLFAK